MNNRLIKDIFIKLKFYNWLLNKNFDITEVY